MKNSILFQASLAFILAGSAMVKASPSAPFEVRYAGQESELTERYAAAYDEESTYNLLWDSLAASNEEEDAVEARQVAEGLVKRENCHFDYECVSGKYCSTKRQQCFRKLSYKGKCSRDGACSSGYCGRSSSRCARKKENGVSCKAAHTACSSGYCSVVNNTCSRKRNVGEKCYSNKACHSGNCARNKCRKVGSHNPTPEPKPTPSGSPYLTE